MTEFEPEIYAEAHRGNIKKASLAPLALWMVEEEKKRISSKGWPGMIRKVYEVDPMVCPKCQGRMRIILNVAMKRQSSVLTDL